MSLGWGMHQYWVCFRCQQQMHLFWSRRIPPSVLTQIQKNFQAHIQTVTHKTMQDVKRSPQDWVFYRSPVTREWNLVFHDIGEDQQAEVCLPTYQTTASASSELQLVWFELTSLKINQNSPNTPPQWSPIRISGFWVTSSNFIFFSLFIICSASSTAFWTCLSRSCSKFPEDVGFRTRKCKWT